jgi:hypothetical protein
VGKSAVTNARKVGVAAPPEVAPENTVLAVSVASVTANVPLEVIGLPATDRMAGTVRATLVTVPTVVVAMVVQDEPSDCDRMPVSVENQ